MARVTKAPVPVNLSWDDITADLKDVTKPRHDRVARIMEFMDHRYARLSALIQKQSSPLSQWVSNPLLDKRLINVQGGYYDKDVNDDDKKRRLRMVFAVSYSGVDGQNKFKDMRLEMLGICCDHPLHNTPDSWYTQFASWYGSFQQLAKSIGSAGVGGVPMMALVPDTMDWQPMGELHDYMIQQLRTSNALISSQTLANGWTDYSFVVK